jgi:hypothetical protein
MASRRPVAIRLRPGLHDDRPQVVGAEMLLDEPACSVLRASRPIGSGTGVVEDHHVHAAIEAARSLLWTSRSIGTDEEIGCGDGSMGISISENDAVARKRPARTREDNAAHIAKRSRFHQAWHA